MLEKLKKSIDRGIVTAGVQSSTFLETGKLRSKIENLEATIQRTKTEMGNAVFTNWKNGVDSTSYIDDVCNRIREMEQEIDGFHEQIRELHAEKDRIISGNMNAASNEYVCSCGQRNSAEAKFCVGCGRAIERVVEQPAEKVCCNCGSPLDNDAKFCTKCGAAQPNA